MQRLFAFTAHHLVVGSCAKLLGDMMKYILILTLLFQALAPSIAFSQIVLGTQTPGFFSTTNFVKNPNAEKNLQNVTASGGSLTRSTSSPLEGVGSFLVDASATSQTFDW